MRLSHTVYASLVSVSSLHGDAHFVLFASFNSPAERHP